MSSPDFEKLYHAFLTDPNNEMATAAAVLMSRASCSLEEAAHLFGAGFAAGYVIRERDALIEFRGTEQ